MRIAFVGDGGKCRGEIEDAVPEEIKKFIDDNAKEIADAVEFRAKATSAFLDKTGMLRNKISAKKSKYEDGGYIVGAWAPHAWLVEHGHDMVDWHSGKNIGHVPAHAFLRPALEAEISSAIAKFGAK